MRISSLLHLVASGSAGISLTDDYDCNCWLIETSEGDILFDTGCGRSTDALLHEASSGGLNLANLRHVFLTHAHADHSGGAARLLTASVSGITFHAGRETAERVASGDEQRISLDSARRFGVYPETYRWEGVAVQDVMADEQTRRIGDVYIQHLATPGHSADHSAYLVTTGEDHLLIAGDAVFAGGAVILQDIPDCDVRATLESVRRLNGLAFEAFLPGHGLFALKDGKRHVAKAAEFARRGLAPPCFV